MWRAEGFLDSAFLLPHPTPTARMQPPDRGAAALFAVSDRRHSHHSYVRKILGPWWLLEAADLDAECDREGRLWLSYVAVVNTGSELKSSQYHN